MNYLSGRINDIKILESIDVDIFNKYYHEIQSYPIGEKRKLYNKDFPDRLDLKAKRIDERYMAALTEKCKEGIEKFNDIRDFC